MEELLAAQNRATLLDGEEQKLYIAHRLNDQLTLVVASDVSAVYMLRGELIMWACALSAAALR